MIANPWIALSPFYVMVMGHIGFQLHQTLFKSGRNPSQSVSNISSWMKWVLLIAMVTFGLDIYVKYRLPAGISHLFSMDIQKIVKLHTLDLPRRFLVPLASASYLWSTWRHRAAIAGEISPEEKQKIPTFQKALRWYDYLTGVFLGAAVGNTWETVFLGRVVDTIPMGFGTANFADLLLITAAISLLFLKDLLREGIKAVRQKKSLELAFENLIILPFVSVAIGSFLIRQEVYPELIHIGLYCIAFSGLGLFGYVPAVKILKRLMRLINEDIKKLASSMELAYV